MPVSVALLRGINVSGQKIIKMDDLRRYFESFGFKNVSTYIQSGNVIFESAKKPQVLENELETKLKRKLGYDVTVVARTVTELEKTIAGCPFNSDKLKPTEKLHVTLLKEKPSPEGMKKLLSFQNDIDEYRIGLREVYILCRKGYGTSLFSNNFLENKLGVLGTTRNWATMNKLVELGKAT